VDNRELIGWVFSSAGRDCGRKTVGEPRKIAIVPGIVVFLCNALLSAYRVTARNCRAGAPIAAALAP